jgi:Na+/proline symporter
VIALTIFGLTFLNQTGQAVDSERVLPMVINRILPVGIKGLVLAGLIAAFMSTFDSGLNVAASYIVNDLVKPVWKNATAKQLIKISYLSTILLIATGVLISRHTESIRQIWNPINFALGAALIIPSLLAPYWWRIGGWAYCLSGLITLPAAFFIYFFTEWTELTYFPILTGLNLIVCLVAGFSFPPASPQTLLIIIAKSGRLAGGGLFNDNWRRWVNPASACRKIATICSLPSSPLSFLSVSIS